MRSLFFLPLAVLLLLPLAAARGSDPAAAELIGRVLEQQRTQGMLIRARLTVADPASDRRTVSQIRIVGQRDGQVSRWLYQVLWPPERKAQAFYIERKDGGMATGFLFEPPDKVTPLTPSLLNRPYLDSDLTIEDLAEDFWQWPFQTISGEETLNGELCIIVEMRPAPEVKGTYSLVRAWISPKKALPLRLEKIGAEGIPAKRWTVQKTVRHDKVWVPMVTLIQTPGKKQETTFELSRGERDVKIPSEEFSMEKIKAFARPAQDSKK